MRAGWLVSLIGHVGAVMMTMLAWEARSTLMPGIGSVVPVEIVDVAEESNVRALARDVPEEDVAPDPDQVPIEAERESAPASRPTPTSRRTRDQQAYEEWERQQRLPDRSKTPGPERANGIPDDLDQRGVGLGTAEVAALEDRVRAIARAHLRRCWRMPIDLPEPDRLIVTVEFELNRNGTLNGQPRVTNPRNYTFDPPMRTAAEAALRAVRQCDPFPFADDPTVGAHYQYWRQQEFTFRPES